MKKTLYIALLLGATVAAASAHNQEHCQRIERLEEALADLKKQAEAEKAQKIKDGKALRIPNTDQTVELVFKPMLHTLFDFGSSNPDHFQLSGIPIKDVSAQQRAPGGFSITPAATRIGFKTNHDTANGPIKALVELDFNGRNNTYISGVGPSGGGRLAPRLRHAYVSYNQFLAGQTNTLFYDGGAMPDMVDMSGMQNAPLRQGQLRVALPTMAGFEVSGSVERPFTDVVFTGSNGVYSSSSTGVTTEGARPTEGLSTRGGQFSQPSLPDAVVAVKYGTPMGYVRLHGVARDLKVKYASGSTNAAGLDFKDRKTGYGIGVSGSINACERLRFLGQYMTGRGLGRYNQDAEGYSAYVDPASKQMDLIRISNYLVGAEWKWTSTIRTNLAYNCLNITPSRFMSSAAAGWNKRMNQAILNTFFKPLPNTDVGVEYMYARKELQRTVSLPHTSPKGTAHRVQMVLMYTF